MDDDGLTDGWWEQWMMEERGGWRIREMDDRRVGGRDGRVSGWMGGGMEWMDVWVEAQADCGWTGEWMDDFR